MLSGFNRNLLKYSIDEDFFYKWNSRVAYILGFTYADGNIYKTSIAWDIQLRDKNILEKFNCAFRSNYPIASREKSFRLRINNRNFVAGAVKSGLLPQKSLRLSFPKIPDKYVRHFIRGYMDGDGWISIRKSKNETDLGFVCGNKNFLKDLSAKIEGSIGIKGKIRTKNKITPKRVESTTYLLEYYSSNAFIVINWIYCDLLKDDLFLDRKFQKYIEAKKLSLFIESGSKKVRMIQQSFGKPMKEILYKLYLQDKLNGVTIAKRLNVHSSSIYRWLEQSEIKCVEHRS